jgi:hypothetical protein
MTGKLTFKLTSNQVIPSATKSPEQDYAAEAENALRPVLARIDASSSQSATFLKVEGAVDGASSVSGPLQTTYSNVEAMASCITPLAEAIKSMDPLMKILGNIAKVSI